MMKGCSRKKIYSWLLLLFAAPITAAPVLQWDASVGADGYNVYCGTTPVGIIAPVNVQAALTYDLDGTVIVGIEYECWVTAYKAGFPESGESNHLVFTPPVPPTVEIVPGPPPGVTITW